MGIISEFKRQAYSGAVADSAAITPADGDSFYATDTDQLFIGLGGSWVHWPRWVNRPTNAIDKQVGDFTTNAAWQVDGLDLSGILPVGTIAVALKLALLDDAANSFFHIRTNAGAAAENILSGRTQVVNVTAYNNGAIPIDSDRLFDYQGPNLAFTVINVTVMAYLL